MKRVVASWQRIDFESLRSKMLFASGRAMPANALHPDSRTSRNEARKES